jgi:hypothetical protein
MVGLAGCYPGVPEALIPYDFKNDPNGDGSLATARPVTWWQGSAVIAGGISIDATNWQLVQSYLGSDIVGENLPPTSEVDVFALGQLESGEQLSVSVDSLVQSLMRLTPLAQADMARNAAAQSLMLVDAQSQIVGWPAAAPVSVDHAGDYFLVVQSVVPSDYTLKVMRTRGEPAPAPHRGVLLLKFDGATGLNATFVGTNGTLIRVTDLPAFDLDIARPDFAGQSQRFRRTVRDLIEYVYADWNVRVTLDETEVQPAGHHDLIVFSTPDPNDLGLGSPSMQLLGTEPTIDVEDCGNQVGIVFIQSFDQAQYVDFNSYAAMWASVAAHEYGHALGLWHVRQDSDSLMTPLLSAPGDGRWVKTLRTAEKSEAEQQSPIDLVENPDAYLSRVLGRRDPAERAAIIERARQFSPELPDP